MTTEVITELAELLDRSESLAGELKELDKTKSELIQILSHELFTPITAIQGFAQVVAERGDKITVDEVRALAEGVTRASERIRRLVGNLAASARLDREGVEASTRNVSAAEILAAAASEFPDERHRLKIPAGVQTSSRLSADPDLAARALVAVIENGLALSPDGAPVEVEVRSDGDSVAFLVKDRGPGVPEDMRERIFDAFTQADASTTREHEGIGIGLYLAKRIMDAHQGTIAVRDVRGKGSVFELVFPAAPAA